MPIISLGVLKVTMSPIAINVEGSIHGIRSAYSRANVHLFLNLCKIRDAAKARATTVTDAAAAYTMLTR
ncbi:hypothetical protein D3C71_1675920 [compost metagenome]